MEDEPFAFFPVDVHTSHPVGDAERAKGLTYHDMAFNKSIHIHPRDIPATATHLHVVQRYRTRRSYVCDVVEARVAWCSGPTPPPFGWTEGCHPSVVGDDWGARQDAADPMSYLLATLR